MAQGSADRLPILSGNAAGPRQPRDRYYVDIRRLIGGDGEISAALEIARKAGLGAWIATGSYIHSGEFDAAGMRIEVASDSRVSARGEGSAMFSARGSLTQLPALAADPRAGSRSLTFRSHPPLAAGDWFILFDPADGSWLESRSYYRAGEWCQVRDVANTVVELAAPLAASYPARRVEAYRPKLASMQLVGGQWDSAGKHLVYLTLCNGATIDVGRLTARANTVVMLDRCIGGTVHIAEGTNAGVGRDDYLICLANSSRCRVGGGNLYSRRHPIAIGGTDVTCGVPNRDCLVTAASLLNDASIDLACADIHGNSERCGYVSCQIHGGVTLGGASPVYRGCTVTARTDGNIAEIAEFKGGHVDLAGTRLSSNAIHVGGGRGLLDFGSQNNALNSATTYDVQIDLTDFTLSAPNLAPQESVIRINNQGSASRLDIIIERGQLDLPAPVQLVRTRVRPGAARSVGITLEAVRGLPAYSIVHYAEDGALKGMSVRSDRSYP